MYEMLLENNNNKIIIIGIISLEKSYGLIVYYYNVSGRGEERRG
jgi:hypothetical protein